MALPSFVRMPLDQRGSRRQLNIGEAFHGSPLDQNPHTASLGGRVQKVNQDARKAGNGDL